MSVAGIAVIPPASPEKKARLIAEEKAAKEAAIAKEAERKKASEVAKRKLDEDLNKFMSRVNEANKKSGLKVVHHVAVKGDIATITVDDSWHLIPYSVRLQVAQGLSRSWIDVRSPEASIELVDRQGNSVGGQNRNGLWVQKN